MLNTSERRVNKNSLTWCYVLKTSWRCLGDVLETFLQDVLKTSWQDVLRIFWRRLGKLSWRCLEDVFRTSWRRPKDVLARRLENALKTSWRCMTKTNILVLTKTSWRRLRKTKTKEVFKTSSSRRMFAGKWFLKLYPVFLSIKLARTKDNKFRISVMETH